MVRKVGGSAEAAVSGGVAAVFDIGEGGGVETVEVGMGDGGGVVVLVATTAPTAFGS